MRISDWSSDVCSSDLCEAGAGDDIGGAAFSPVVEHAASAQAAARASSWWRRCMDMADSLLKLCRTLARAGFRVDERGRTRRSAAPAAGAELARQRVARSEEHTSELQSLMRTSYAVC